MLIIMSPLGPARVHVHGKNLEDAYRKGNLNQENIKKIDAVLRGKSKSPLDEDAATNETLAPILNGIRNALV
jgi:hypothetical protein